MGLHDKADLITYLFTKINVVCYCKWFTIYALINQLYDGGAAKYRCQMGSLLYLLFFICICYYMHLNIYLSRLIPQVAENAAARALSEAKPLAWRRPTPKAEGLRR